MLIEMHKHWPIINLNHFIAEASIRKISQFATE